MLSDEQEERTGMPWQPPRAPRGTADILPDEARRWQRIEREFRAIAERYGYREIRTPIFEATELYVRGMGEATDVVEKEMFTVSGPGAERDAEKLAADVRREPAEPESFSLRPEFTAGVVRAYRQHGLDKTQGFLKVYAFGPLFRYERPQKGRLRQFHQVNVEALATREPLADVEMIALAHDFIAAVGVPEFRVRLNSIGHESPECRGRYREMLRERLRPRFEALCDACKARFERNVFRVLDCKRCVELTAGLPPMAEHLCADCAAHFAVVRAGLDGLAIAYAVDARLVRGFDYYTRTVFEFPSERLGAQDALGGGGRYDRLIPEMGGPEAGACGFALGMERLLLAMPGEAGAAPERGRAVYVVATPEPRAREAAFFLATELRRAGIEADLDFEGKSVKAQMRAANRSGYGWVAVLGPEELAHGYVSLKKMDARPPEQGEVKARRAAAVEYVGRAIDANAIVAGGEHVWSADL
jgi:histidyl-tRNA synthetase